MAGGGPDPFYAVRDALSAEVATLDVQFRAWQAALAVANTATDVAFRIKHDEFTGHLGKTEEMCRKVKGAVLNIERFRSRYPHVDDRELASRKQFVEQLEGAIMSMRAVVGSRDTRAKFDADARRELHARTAAEVRGAEGVGGASGGGGGGGGGAGGRAGSAYTAANADYLASHAQAQATMRREQDEVLGKMGSSLDRLNEMAREMDSELKEQGRIMEDVDSELTAAQGKMDAAIGHVEKLLQTKDRCKMATICFLVVAFVITAIVAFYMITK